MIVFEQGVPAKGQYRKFILIPRPSARRRLCLDGGNADAALRRWQSAEEAASGPGSKVDASFSRLPDLVIVDGGKGQLGRVVKVLENFELAEKVPVVGLAKQEEEIFFPHRSNSLKLPRHSQGLYLVQRIRDEAHRFGITAHRARRSKQGMASALDSVPGVGPARRKALLKHFGSVDKIRSATMEELASVQGINADVAESIKASLE
jgi:Nuclease subunit of the excinuclease complex